MRIEPPGRRLGWWWASAAVLVALSAVALALSPAPAPARRHADSWHALARAVAAPWPRAQTRAGTFRGGLRGTRSTGYGTALLGYGLIQTGVRDHDRRLLRAGIRAVSRTVRVRRRANRRGDGVFESLAVAAAYNVVRAQAPRDRGFRRARRAWQQWLRRVRPVYLGAAAHGRRVWWRSYFNKHLVEAVEVLELLRTGLHSRRRGTVLHARRRAARVARRLVERTVPALARAGAFDLGGGRRAALVASNSRAHLAYHGLTLGLYGRAVDLLGLLGRRRAGPVARATLRRLADRLVGARGAGRRPRVRRTLGRAGLGAHLHRLRRGRGGAGLARPDRGALRRAGGPRGGPARAAAP